MGSNGFFVEKIKQTFILLYYFRSNGYTVFCKEKSKTLENVVGVSRFLKLGQLWKDTSGDEKARYHNLYLAVCIDNHTYFVFLQLG